MFNRLTDKLHEKYISKVEAEKKRINKENWSAEKMKGYVSAYFNHGFPLIRSLFGDLPVLGEPPIIEACIEESARRRYE